MMAELPLAAPPSTAFAWTLILLATALSLALVVMFQIAATYSSAYMAAPREMATFVDAVDFSVQENESYDADITRIPRLEDKMRLGRLLREIQKGGDDLREDLNALLAGESGTVLRTGARVLWASHRKGLEERVRRLDLLRMRFLVVYMGILAATAGDREKAAERAAAATTATATAQRDPEKTGSRGREPPRPGIPRSFTEEIKKRPPMRRLTTQAIGHNEKVEPPHRMGWMGVVQELQKSPLMHRRHASIEQSMKSPPLSPLNIATPSPSPMPKLSLSSRTPSPKSKSGSEEGRKS